MSDSDNKILEANAERDEVLAKLSEKQDILRKKVLQQKLNEDDFVQLLNLATKIDLVEQATDLSVSQIEEIKEQEKLAAKRPIGGSGGAVIGAAIAGPGGAVAGNAAGIGVGAGAIAIVAPIVATTWLWGKGKEIVRTFKTSYNNDTSKNRLGNALVRAIKYPLFKVPLINKMRQDINFDATLEQRRELKKEVKANRIKNGKEELKIFGKTAGFLAGALGAAGATLSALPIAYGIIAGTATSAVLAGEATFLVGTAAVGAALGGALGTVAYALNYLQRLDDSIESKSFRGRRLIEQAMIRKSENQNTNTMEQAGVSIADERSSMKAKLRGDNTSAQKMAQVLEKNVSENMNKMENSSDIDRQKMKELMRGNEESAKAKDDNVDMKKDKVSISQKFQKLFSHSSVRDS